MNMVRRASGRIVPPRTHVGFESGQLTVVDPGPFFNDEHPRKQAPRHVLVKCSCDKEFYTREQSILKGLSLRCSSCKNKRHAKVMERAETGWNIWWNRYFQNARNRGIDFNLSVPDVKKICSMPCSYCGADPAERKSQREANTINASGIDRVDPKLGYEPGNVVPCCSDCNQMKWTFTQQEFLEKIRTIINYTDKHNLLRNQ